MTPPVRIHFPNDCSPNHPAMRAWRIAIDRANDDLRKAMGWRLAINFNEMTFSPMPAEPKHTNVVQLRPSFAKAHAFLHPQGDGPRTAA